MPERLEKMLLQPGHNCWRIETATRLQFLIDGDAYFKALRAAIARAQRSVHIIGWDIDSRVALPRVDANDRYPEPLAKFLDAVARARRDLNIYVLSWDYALLFALEREWLPVWPLQWRTHRRVHFRLDNRHPVGASHHQKLVVIDDRVAFVGGLDITRCRWDTPAHEPFDPRRTDADGNAYAPFHDVQVIVEGPVARALGELARNRWQRATRRRPRSRRLISSAAPVLEKKSEKKPVADDEHPSPWPPGLAPALANIRVAIARTEPAFEDSAGCIEIRNFYLDAIAAARDFIFFENQYFSSNAIAQALSERLRDANGPAVIVITPRKESGWLEETTMGLLRARLYERLQSHTQANRFHPFSPLLRGGIHLNVHSKLMIADDEWLTIGSANISNRSMNLDTECNLMIEAAPHGERAGEVRQAIAHLRNRLMAEHLDCDLEMLSNLQRRMPFIAAIETLRGEKKASDGERGLIAAEPLPAAENILLTDAMLIDPEAPLEPERVLANYIARRDRRSVRAHAARIGIAVIIFAALILAWRETPLREYLNINHILQFVERIHRQPLAPLLIMALYIVAGFFCVPIVLIIAATGAVFGPWLGFVYATSGSLLSAATMFWIGTKTGAGLWQQLFRGRVYHLQARLQKQGLLAVAITRAMPIAPFTVVNLIAGAAQIRWRDFMLGTLTGMLPGIILTVLFVDRAAAALRRPTLASIATLVMTMAAIVAVSLLLQHWLRHRNLKTAAGSHFAENKPAMDKTPKNIAREK